MVTADASLIYYAQLIFVFLIDPVPGYLEARKGSHYGQAQFKLRMWIACGYFAIRLTILSKSLVALVRNVIRHLCSALGTDLMLHTDAEIPTVHIIHETIYHVYAHVW